MREKRRFPEETPLYLIRNHRFNRRKIIENRKLEGKRGRKRKRIHAKMDVKEEEGREDEPEEEGMKRCNDMVEGKEMEIKKDSEKSRREVDEGQGDEKRSTEGLSDEKGEKRGVETDPQPEPQTGLRTGPRPDHEEKQRESHSEDNQTKKKKRKKRKRRESKIKVEGWLKVKPFQEEEQKREEGEGSETPSKKMRTQQQLSHSTLALTPSSADSGTCDALQEKVIHSPGKFDSSVASIINSLCVDLIKKWPKSGHNLVYSPKDIVVGLASLSFHSKEETTNDLFHALKCYRFFKTWSEYYVALVEFVGKYFETNKSPPLGSSSSSLTLISKRLKIRRSFRGEMKASFNCRLEHLNFSQSILETVNGWVNNETKGTIASMNVKPIEPNRSIVSLNAVCFKRRFKLAFDQNLTQELDFYNNGLRNKGKKISFLFKDDAFNMTTMRLSGVEYRLLELEIEGNVSVFILLPQTLDGLGKIVKCLDYSRLKAAMKQMRKRRVSVYLPKLRVDSCSDLIPVLKSLGLEPIFDRRADLTGLVRDDVGEGAVISEMAHKVDFEVNGNVPEVSSTGINGETEVLRECPEYRADHPFLFYALDNSNDLILFMGTVDKF